MAPTKKQSEDTSEINMASKVLYVLAGWIFWIALVMCIVDPTN